MMKREKEISSKDFDELMNELSVEFDVYNTKSKSDNTNIIEEILSKLLSSNKDSLSIDELKEMVLNIDDSFIDQLNEIYKEVVSIFTTSNIFDKNLKGDLILSLSVDEIKASLDTETAELFAKMKYYKQFYITHNNRKYNVKNSLKSFKKQSFNTVKNTSESNDFECWGYADGGVNYVWSNAKQSLYQLTSRDFTENSFFEMFGSKILNSYAKYDKEGNQRLDARRLTQDLIDGCINAGLFNPNKMYGFGIFGFKDGVIVNSDEIWSNVEEIKDRKLEDGRFFIKKERVNVSKNDTITQDEFELIKSYFKSWNYKSEKDFFFNIGHTFSSCLAGVNSFNSVLYLVAPPGSGKSKMMKDKMLFSAGLAKKFDAKTSSAIGIQQEININCYSVLIDEAEAVHSTTKSMIEFARSAVDGKSDNMSIKGTTSGKARILRARAGFTFASVARNNLEEADVSRSQEIELMSIKNKEKHFLYDEDSMKEDLGSKVISYIVANWKSYRKICKSVYDYMFKNVCNVERFLDVQHQPYATYLFMNRDVLTMSDEQLKMYVADFMSNLDFTNEIINQVDKTAEEETCLRIVLSSVVRDEISNSSKSVIELINQYCISKNREEATSIRNTLGRIGIKAEDKNEYLNIYLSTKESSFINLLKSTKYATTDLTSLLKRHEKATLITDSVMVGGLRAKRSSVVLMTLSKSDYSFAEEDLELMQHKKIGYYA